MTLLRRGACRGCGWIALPAVLLLGARSNAATARTAACRPIPPSSIPSWPWAWILTVGWFGFNVMSAQTLDKISGLVAVNSPDGHGGRDPGRAGDGQERPWLCAQRPLAGLVAVCAGSDLMHPLGALVVGAMAGGIFVVMFTLTQNKWKIDDVLGVWPARTCAAPGAALPGILAARRWVDWVAVSLGAQLVGTGHGRRLGGTGGYVVYGLSNAPWACA